MTPAEAIAALDAAAPMKVWTLGRSARGHWCNVPVGAGSIYSTGASMEEAVADAVKRIKKLRPSPKVPPRASDDDPFLDWS